MEIRRHGLDPASPFTPCVAALGIFDGFHIGHQQLMEGAHARAKHLRKPLAVITFDPHPSILLAPEHRPRLLMTLEQRLAAFQQAGADLAWVIPFSRAFSELNPSDFLKDFTACLSPVELHVGNAFRFAHQRKGDISTLVAWGPEVGCTVHPCGFRAHDGGALSSTRIREVLDAGDADEACALLGRPFNLTGIVVEGDRRGRHLGFPTANLSWEQEQLPAAGVFVTEVRCSHFEGVRLGLTNVGMKPTFQGSAMTVETYLPNFSDDIYGARLDVGFRHRLRGEKRFEGLDALRAQIAEDVIRGEAWWMDHHRKH